VDLSEHLFPFYRVFSQLSATRRYDFGVPMRISILEVLGYAELNGIQSRSYLQDLWFFIQELDEEFFLLLEKSRKK